MFRFLYRVFLTVSIAVFVAIVAFRLTAMSRENQSADNLLTPDSEVVETQHGQLHLVVKGPEDGLPILLVHGSVGWAGLWRETMQILAGEGYRAYAIDLPPMGLSQRDTRMDFSRQAQALRLLGATDALGVQPVIVAHSFGAGAAVEALMVSPDSFRGAVIIAGALGLGQDGTGQEMPLPLQPKVIREAALSATITNPFATKLLFQQFVHRKESITDTVVEVLEKPFVRDGTTETLAAWLPTLLVPPRGALSSDPKQYSQLNQPVSLIWGRQDTVTPPDQAEALRAALGDAPVFWMDDTGHIPQIEDPETFHNVLVQALAGIEEG